MEYRLVGADVDVMGFLRKCEERRASERPLRSRMSWRDRPKWNGKIINLIPVVGDVAVAPNA